MKISREFSFPSPDTLSIPPISNFVRKYLLSSKISLDPFARNSRFATLRNDLDPGSACEYHMDAEEFCNLMYARGVRPDLVIFDPPYSPTQMKICYNSIGIEHSDGGSNTTLYSRVRRSFHRMLLPGAVVLTFGWNSSGMSSLKCYEIEEILLVCHGQGHNDTICVAERKVQSEFGFAREAELLTKKNSV